MCSNPSQAQQKISSKGAHSSAEILSYTPPVYRENGAGAYVEFFAFDPEQAKMRRKIIKLNRVKNSRTRKAYARDVILRLNERLLRGWNPWINQREEELVPMGEVLDRYESHIDKMLQSGYYRKETYAGYKSYAKILREYAADVNPIHYCYQFDKKFCSEFLDYVFIDRDNGAQTRNNYLNFLRVFAGWLVEKSYLTSRPTDGLKPISKRLYNKKREIIPAAEVAKIAGWCKVHEPHFLFACYLLYYCFIRPVEMTRLKVEHFNLQQSTITIPAEASKNKQTQTVTMPRKVLLYGIETGMFTAPMGDFIFGEKMKPGPVAIDTKIFRDYWEKVRKALGFRKEWKFYSLKDTGITEMCRNNVASITVRDQARHSSLAITDIYTGHNTQTDEVIVQLDGSL